MLMPGGINGRELAEQLREQRPGLKAVFTSGYSGDVLGQETDFIRRLDGCFVQKPCSAQALLKTVRGCLDRQ